MSRCAALSSYRIPRHVRNWGNALRCRMEDRTPYQAKAVCPRTRQARDPGEND